MKRISLHAAFLLLLFLSGFSATAQVVPYKAWQDTTGHPNLTLSLLVGVRDASDNLLIGGNTYEADSEYVLITKYNTSGATLWQQKTSAGGGKRGFVTHITSLGGNVYTCGGSWDSVNNKAKWNTIKLNGTTGAALWSKTYSGTYVGYDVPASIVTDSLGYSYVAGTEQTATNDYEVTVIKYDTSGNVVWTSHYDSVGLYDGAVALAISYATGNVIMTGYSGSAFNTWDFLTIGFNMSTGAKSGVTRASNGSGAFVSHPASLAIGEHNSIYVVGAAAGTTSGNVDVKIIKYDSLFNQLWVKTWGLPDSLDDEPAYMVINHDVTQINITGYATHANGQVDLVTMVYDKDGNVLWNKAVTSTTGAAHLAQGTSIVADDSSNVYVTGKLYNGSNYDIVTSAYNKIGTPLWQQVYDGGGSDDVGMNVSLDASNNVYVSGTTTTGGSSAYITIKYEQQKDSLGLGEIVPSYILDRINYSDYVFEGRIIGINSYENNPGDYIYTANNILITKVFKGDLACGTVELITLGGSVGDTTLSLSHNIQFTGGESGIFLAQQTTRPAPNTSFYTNTDTVKLYMPYNEQGFVRYNFDGVNRLIQQPWGAWDSLTPLYNLMQYACHTSYFGCKDTLLEGLLSGFNAKNNPTIVPFPHYSKTKFDYQMMLGRQRASKAIHSVARDAGTITYTFQNPIITGTATKYLEFDVALSDDLGSGYFDNGLVHILYDSTVFGANVVTNHVITVTRGTVIASSDYLDPTPGDISDNVVAIPLNADTATTSLYSLSGTPTKAVHVKMQIANCDLPGTTISMIDGDVMLALSFYSATPNTTLDSAVFGYNAVDNSSSFPMPACSPAITSFDPQPISAGTGTTLNIHGYQFGATRGAGTLSFKNSNDGGLTDVTLDSYDYVSWNDTLIKVILPSIVDSLNTTNHQYGFPGSGVVTIKTDGGDIVSSTTPITILYSAANVIDSFTDARKKYLDNLFDYYYSGGYRFSIDSSVYSHPEIKGCIVKAIHDWVCLTNVNFQIGSDTIMPQDSVAHFDHVNLISMAPLDDALALARTNQWVNARCPLIDKKGVEEIDLIINSRFFNQLFADTNANDVPSGEYDVFAFILHELGHAHSLYHVNDTNAVMFFNVKHGPIPGGSRKIKLYTDESSYTGGDYIVTQSQNPAFVTNCGWTEMEELSTSYCRVFTSEYDFSSINNINVFPNPVSNTLNIQYLLLNNASVQIRVSDIVGNNIFNSESAIQNSGEELNALNVANWENGFYLINIRVNNENHVVKIIKD